MDLQKVLQHFKNQDQYGATNEIDQRQTINTITMLLKEWSQSPYMKAYQETFTEVYGDAKNAIGQYLITQAVTRSYRNVFITKKMIQDQVLAPINRQMRRSEIKFDHQRLDLMLNDFANASRQYELPFVTYRVEPDFTVNYRCLATQEKATDLLLIKNIGGIDFETQIPLREMLSNQGQPQLQFGSNWCFKLRSLPALLDSYHLKYHQIDLERVLLEC